MNKIETSQTFTIEPEEQKSNAAEPELWKSVSINYKNTNFGERTNFFLRNRSV